MNAPSSSHNSLPTPCLPLPPQGQHPAGAFDVKTATLSKGRKGSMGGDDDRAPGGVKKAQSMRAQRGVHFNTSTLYPCSSALSFY